MNTIPHNKPYIGAKEIQEVSRVLESQWLIRGKEVEQLEQRIKQSVGASYALALNNGTSALHVSLLALGIRSDDEVVIPTYTCSSLLSAVHYTGATAVLVDSASESFLIGPEEVRRHITPRTKAIIVPHTFGLYAPIQEIQSLGIPVIEDCAIGIGGLNQEKPYGSSGDISIFSFYATKMIAAGQGGMIVTDNKSYFEKALDTIHNNAARTYSVRYNYSMTDITASIANVQLSRLPDFVKRRKSIAAQYKDILAAYPMLKYWPKHDDTESNHYRFILKFSSPDLRDQVQEYFKIKGIHTIVPIESYQLLHNLFGMNSEDFPTAEHMAQTTLSLPVYPALTDEEVHGICTALRSLPLKP